MSHITREKPYFKYLTELLCLTLKNLQDIILEISS